MNPPSSRTDLLSGLALLRLLALTVALSYVDLGPFNTAVSMLISIAKAALILLFFMHIKYSRPIIWLFAGAGFGVAARRARTVLCGPYVDVAFVLWPWPEALYRWNNCAADLLPFRAAADWMFLLFPQGS